MSALVDANKTVLYHVPLQSPTGITDAIFGSFSEPKAQEIVVSRGDILELLRPDSTSGKIMSILTWEVFGCIRCIKAFRLTGDKIDHVVVGSDSGRISILRYDAEVSLWRKVHEETFGKSGCRRIVPGQYLAVDPRGRTVMIGAIEKQKLVYVLSRDSEDNMTISSPLSAHKANTLVFDMVGVDVGFDNPMFACIEVNYAEEERTRRNRMDVDGESPVVCTKYLTYYQHDLSLNTVTRKVSEQIDEHSNRLITVPGGDDGPGGVLVCANSTVSYHNMDHEPVTTHIPCRYGADPLASVLVVAIATHRQKNLFFFLIQTELGDIFKVTLNYEGEQVSDVVVQYFDTVPVVVSMCVLKTGFLFCASEFGDHSLFQFQGIGQDSDVTTTKDSDASVKFTPRTLVNLLTIDEMDSATPITGMLVDDLAAERTPQVYLLSGRGTRSSLRVLRHGLAVSEEGGSELPGSPTAVWAVRTNVNDEYHKYIVVSFVNATIVLSIGDTVTEVSDSGVLDNKQTLLVSTLGNNSLLQVYKEGIRHIRSDQRISEWKTPLKKDIVECAVNERQVVIALQGGEIIYFELDHNGNLSDTSRKDMGTDVSCLAIAPIPEGRLRSNFLAVGGYDNTVRILSLDVTAGDPLQQLSVQAMQGANSQPCSLKLSQSAKDKLMLVIGLRSGVLIRSTLDETSGTLSDMRKKFIGSKPVQLFLVRVGGQDAVVAISSRTWLLYRFHDRLYVTPLSYEELEYCSSFVSEQCPEGLVCIAGNSLRILSFDRLGEQFNQQVMPLRYTPRRLIAHPTTHHLIILEAEHNAYSARDKQAWYEAHKDVASPVEEEAFMGAPRPGAGVWGSCIRIVDPTSMESKITLELDDNYAALSVCVCQFENRGDEYFLVVGACKGLKISPKREMSGCAMLVYQFGADMNELQLVHSTPVDDVPLAMTAYNRRLLVGVGGSLRVYEMGKKKLLRKCENNSFPSTINFLDVRGERIYVGDMCESFFLAKYVATERLIHVYADTSAPRYLSASTVVDYDTMAGGDKFGNLYVARLQPDAEEDRRSHMATTTWGNTLVSGAPNKLLDLNQYHLGDVIMALHRGSMGGADILLYATIMGGIGAFVPVVSRDDIEFFSHLEMHMRQTSSPLCGRDHLAYRSAYFPVKDVIDGSLCEQYAYLTADDQKSIAEELVTTPVEVLKRLEELRSQAL